MNKKDSPRTVVQGELWLCQSNEIRNVRIYDIRKGDQKGTLIGVIFHELDFSVRHPGKFVADSRQLVAGNVNHFQFREVVHIKTTHGMLENVAIDTKRPGGIDYCVRLTLNEPLAVGKPANYKFLHSFSPF